MRERLHFVSAALAMLAGVLLATTAWAEESPVEKHRKKIAGQWEGKPFDLEFSLKDTKSPYVMLQYKEPIKGEVTVRTIRVALKEKVGISWIAFDKMTAENLGLPEELFYSFDGNDLVVQAESGRFKGKHRLNRPAQPDSRASSFKRRTRVFTAIGKPTACNRRSPQKGFARYSG